VTRRLICAIALTALIATAAPTALLSKSGAKKGIDWNRDIRAALEEAEGRGVPLLLYLTRDD